jgi:hypothetical protein
LEVTDFWDETLEPIVIERDHAKLVGCVTFERGKEESLQAYCESLIISPA